MRKDREYKTPAEDGAYLDGCWDTEDRLRPAIEHLQAALAWFIDRADDHGIKGVVAMLDSLNIDLATLNFTAREGGPDAGLSEPESPAGDATARTAGRCRYCGKDDCPCGAMAGRLA